MKKWIPLVLALCMTAVLASGCSTQRQTTLMGNHVNLSYAGAQRDGTHQYTSDVGELVWQKGKPITLNGSPFAQISGRTGIFTFPDGRQIEGQVDAKGELSQVTVKVNTEVRKQDYAMMEAAILVHQVENAIISHQNTVVIITMLILILLAAIALFLMSRICGFMVQRRWISSDKTKAIVKIGRWVGIGLIVVAILVGVFAFI